MNWLKILTLILFSLLFTLLDVSFFSFIQIYGVTIISTFLIIISFSLLVDTKLAHHDLLIFQSSSLIMFSVLSSVPIWLLLIGFIIIPGVIVYLRENYVSYPSVFVVIAIFLLSNFIFEIILFLSSSQTNQNIILPLLYFVFINTIVGFAIYQIAFYFQSHKPEIRL